MEYSLAETSCVLKINTQCDVCKVQTRHILQKIHGVYNVTIDGEEGTMKVTGKVNPNTLLSVLLKYGKHAEIKYATFEGEVVERNYNFYGEHGYNPYDRMQNCPYPYPNLYPYSQPCNQHQGYHHTYPHYSRPPPPPPPAASIPRQFSPAPPPGPFWEPPQSHPPPPPSVNGSTGRSPSKPVSPSRNFVAEETLSRQHKQSKCAMM